MQEGYQDQQPSLRIASAGLIYSSATEVGKLSSQATDPHQMCVFSPECIAHPTSAGKAGELWKTDKMH